MHSFSWYAMLVLTGVATALAHAAEPTPAPSNGIDYPKGWQDWQAISVSHRADNNTIRLILGNDMAVKAARTGKTNPWPDGAILGKVVWKAVQMDDWKDANVPSDLVHAEFMLKDSKKYAESYGWGWGRWLGLEQKPFDRGANSCIDCHTPVKGQDWVFTQPAVFPR